MFNVIARNENVPGFSKKDTIQPNERVLYSFSNNLKFEITSNVSVDLDILYSNRLENRYLFMIINTSKSISLEMNSMPNMQDFGISESPQGPYNTQNQWRNSYGCIFRIKSNGSIDQLTIRFKKSSEFNINPNTQSSIGLYELTNESWEILTTEEITEDATSEVYLETVILDINADTDYFITIFEVEDFSIWIWITIIAIIGFVSITLLMSKTEYFDFLKRRLTPIDKGAHRLTLEEVLENENRDKIIDLILKEPGIHFNELLRRTELAAGNLVWHLDILETYKVIGKKRIGNYIAYFPYYQKNPISNLDLKLSKSKLTLEILELIENEPGVWNSIITKKKKVDHKTIQYHIQKLLDLGIIHSKKEGIKRKFYPNLESEYYNNKDD